MKIDSITLLLEKFEILTEIGVHAFETGCKQRVWVDVEMTIDLDLQDKDDSLKNTVDYDFLRMEIKGLAAQKRFNTQEALCMAVLSIIFRHPHVAAARVTTRKPDVYPDAEAVGCSIAARA
jgi:dihydroneopterin aldolase